MTKLKNVMVICFIFSCFLSFSQPLDMSSVGVKNITLNGKILFFKRINNKTYKLIFEQKLMKKKFDSDISISVSKNEKSSFTNFVYKKDTMKIKLIYNQYKEMELSIIELQFKKGVFLIDILECAKKLKIKNYALVEIRNFPCDCMNYRKEEEEK
ncbi:hypothetical protein KHA90_05805 [Flavobacterium psychroterrae]|uniref:Uncharacterized protein n=1 Tax=Flavobacterium psychroterrae TaxID=2133767 RepID=A0ABS5P8C7_9FLAO|nr:hypothetical protein [Flavobacterium psychroterrae]MBS7230531.1 hypothetical protein [Flavobacterium psychroterrae]